MAALAAALAGSLAVFFLVGVSAELTQAASPGQNNGRIAFSSSRTGMPCALESTSKLFGRLSGSYRAYGWPVLILIRA